MKKIVSVLLIICMMTMFTAFAADAKVGVTMHGQEGLDFTLMENRHLLEDDELNGARKVLIAAALTYVAAMISALLSLVRLLLIVNRRRR